VWDRSEIVHETVMHQRVSLLISWRVVPNAYEQAALILCA
jgi:hypothetical protein